jgi:hypothetical protein
LLSFFLSRLWYATLKKYSKKKPQTGLKQMDSVKVTKKDLERKVKDSISPSDTIIKGNKKSEESIFRRKVRYKADKYAKLIKTNLLLYMRQNSIIKI